MKAVFADTFYWIAMSNPGDSRYRDAISLELDAVLITTDEVLSEFLTFFSGDSWGRKRAVATVTHLLSDPHVSVVPQSRGSFLA